jgi:hypothetical protein
MSVLKVFSGILKKDELNNSLTFDNAVGLFISTPNLDTEYEIDCYVQVHISIEELEFTRNYPLSKIKDDGAFFNRVDTDTLFILPRELLDTSAKLSLVFLSSDNTFLEAYILVKDDLNTSENIISKQRAFFFIN